MRRFGRTAAVLLLGAALLSGIPASAAAKTPPAGSVVIVLAPYITWADITSGAMPATRALAESATTGNVNIRSSSRYAPILSQMHVALTMSSGAPVMFDPIAPSAYVSSQRLEVDTAAEAYRRSMGSDPGSAAIVYLGLPRVLRANSEGTISAVPGALGQAIIDAGGTTAALGNSDGGYIDGDVFRSRPAAVIAMDAFGRVTFGDVSTGLLAERTDAPYGLETDQAALEAAYRSSLRQTAAHGGPGLLVLDPGDPERAFNFMMDASLEAAEQHRLAAAAALDRVVGFAVEELPDDAVLMIVSTGQSRPELGPSGFGPVIISGRGFEGGLVSSSSTHRTGLMTDLDVSATTLGALGVERPVEILGNAASSDGSGGALPERADYLMAMDDTAVAVDTVRPIVQNSYITVTVIVLLGCAALLRSMQRSLSGWGGRAVTVFSQVILFMLCMPVAATLMYLFAGRPGSAATVAVLFAVTTVAVWLAAHAVDRRWGSPVALAFVGLLSAGVLLADQALGAPLSFSGMFSYSPLLGARYYGLGNEGASIIVGGGLAGLALVIDAFRDRSWVRRVRSLGPLLLGAVIVFISAAPFLGANIGVIAWGTVAFGIMWMQLNDRPVTWKSIVAMLGVIGLVVAAFSAYDLLGGAGTQTHLGRAWESAGTGGVGQLWLIIARKAETNWRVLRATNWSILMIAILAFLGFMRWRPHGVFAETLKAYPAFAIAMTASLWGSLVGYFTEDSGIVIPALVMLYITGSLLYVMLSRLGEGETAVSG